jgi:ribose/xylose/arabinose/galactoside ABC-type transport system permease subunit
MNIIVMSIIICLVAALLIYAVDTLEMDPRLAQICKGLIILLAVVMILDRSGIV